MKDKKRVKKTGEEKKTKRYGHVSNIMYAMKNMAKMDKVFLILVLTVGPLGIINPLLESYFSKVLIDRFEKGISFENACLLVAGFMGLILGITVFIRFLYSRYEARSYYLTLNYQRQYADFHFHTDFENTEKQDYLKAYGLVERDACQGNASVEYVGFDIGTFIKDIFGIVSCASLMAVVNPILFLIIMVVAVLSFFTTRMQSRYYEKNKDKWEKEERKKGYLENIFKDFDKAKDIKLYGMEGWLEKTVKDYQKYILTWHMRCNRRGLLASILAGLMSFIQNAATYMVLLALLINGKISVGDFVFFFTLVGTISGCLQGVFTDVANLVSRSDKIAYYREYFDYPSKLNHGEGVALPAEDEPIRIELKNVSYRYAGAEEDTIKGINLTIEGGEKIALVGMNGAGKTTLVKLICGFYSPTEGEILVNGKNINEYNIDEYYSIISAVFQDIYVMALTICEFVASTDLTRSDMRERAKDALIQAGLWEKVASLENGMDTHLMKGVYEDGVDLSGGELQKLMLARAIYKDGRMLILDEPTAALDPIAENNLYLKYNELTQGKTSIYISHRFASTRFCDRIILLEDGVIKESGSHKELMDLNGRYAYMFDVQSKYYKEEMENVQE